MTSRRVSQSCLQHSRSSVGSAARVFLQLAPRRNVHASRLLDFLTPNLPTGSATPRTHVRRHVLKTISVKSFSSVSIRRTAAIVNPRRDDDGVDMNIEITPRASNRLKEIMAKDGNPDLALRIQVESGGCHGFQYLMSLITLPSPNTINSGSALNKSSADPNALPTKSAFEDIGVVDEDDTVFAAEDGSGAKVVMDGPSLELLKGSKVDYTMELIGSQFKIVDNPLATSSCGCGTSFDIKA